MKRFLSRARTGSVRAAGVAAVLGLGLCALTLPADAERAAPVPVAVVNGDFALPAFTADPNWAAVQGWSVGSTNGSGTSSGVARYGPNSGHPAGKAAVMLRFPLPAYAFKQRLRGVRPGAQVTVTFDDSPGVAAACTPGSVADGQSYTVEGTGGAASTRTTAPDPDKKAGTLGKGVWRTGQTYTFTAGEYEPLLTFTSQVPNSANAGGGCGPLIADVRATQAPPPVDKTIPKTALPPSLAFYGNDSRPVADAVNYCLGVVTRCVFTPAEEYSYSYYEPAQVNGDAYINCTRNELKRARPLTFGGRSYGDLPANAGLPPNGTTVTNLAQQYVNGIGAAPDWTTTTTRNVTEVVQPSEASWIETQAGRRRTEGWFTSSPAPADPNTEWRLYTVLDHAATTLPDRVYQRTGPMTSAEKLRCRSDRPTAPTPVGAGDPAGFTRG
ncbi:hypothetical protein Ssi03_58920 [Sphaerisporangium siamense]|uniref:Uncharacterized protein n=1 Tax=Sphaerisporangium siamense TaxID=795645 RepID=A0A7W7D3P7_9ACTN|nr:hypothetical protein [Sphaerisporangium siamense]MBB4699722.1 hypothetical protein [Sphaerisporangium siamense]GII87902.1 hypothetical protein Ssi03_58920 [Sphaerisporangium siamense]